MSIARDPYVGGTRVYSGLDADRVLAAVVLFLLPVQTLHLTSRSLDGGVFVAFLMLPMTLAATLRWKKSRSLVSLLVLCGLSGAVLAEFSVGIGRDVNRSYEFGILGLLGASILVITTCVWAREKLSLPSIVMWFALGPS